jgi:hypothetical protein
MDCACKSPDEYSCWAYRYYGYDYPDTDYIRRDGGPCECRCHMLNDDLYDYEEE